MRVDQMTAAELERELVRVLVPGEASFEAMQELVNRARAVELLEPHLVELDRARARTRDRARQRALDACSELVMLASPSRRQILRNLEREEAKTG